MKKEFIAQYIASYENLILILNGETGEEELDKIKKIGYTAIANLEQELCNNLDLVPEVQEIIKNKDIVRFKELLKDDPKITSYVLGFDLESEGTSEAEVTLKVLKHTELIMEKQNDFSLEIFISLTGFYGQHIRMGRTVLAVIQRYFSPYFDVDLVLSEIVGASETLDFIKDLLNLIKEE